MSRRLAELQPNNDALPDSPLQLDDEPNVATPAAAREQDLGNEVVPAQVADQRPPAANTPLPDPSGFPRPPFWPAVLTWPPSWMAEAEAQIGRDAPSGADWLRAWREKWLAGETKAMAERVDKLRKSLRLSDDAQIQVALLLLPPLKRTLPDVAKIGADRMLTADQGEVGFTAARLTCPKPTSQSVKLLVLEAVARGWTSIEISGTAEFKLAVAREASEAGLNVFERRGSGLRLLVEPPVDAPQQAPGAEKQTDRRPEAAPQP